MMKTGKIFSTFSLIMMIACNYTGNTEEVPFFDADTSVYLRVYDNMAGSLYLNGNLVSPEMLESRFAQLEKKGGLVYCAFPDSSEHLPENSKVTELLKKYKLPLKKFYDSTFKSPIY